MNVSIVNVRKAAEPGEKMKSSHVVAAVLWVAVSSTVVPLACAADPVQGWYAGGNLGGSRGGTNDGTVVASLASVGMTGTATSSNTDTAGKLFVGYLFNANFAMEGGYFNLGRFTANGAITAPAASTFSTSTKYQGGNIDLVGIVPFGGGPLSGFARLGATYIQASNTTDFSNAALAAQYGDPSKNKLGVDAGLGLQFQFTKTVAGRLEWQRYFSVPSGPSTTASIDFFSLGITLKF